MPFAAFVIGCFLADTSGPGGTCGYLYQPAFSVDHELREPARPYVPRAGDLFLATDERFVAAGGHLLVHSGAPHHSGIFFAQPDGELALLEGGPDNTWFIRVLDPLPHMTWYAGSKRVWIRQRTTPLTDEQSRRLTAFALEVADRRFAQARMLLQVTPLRSKGPVRTPLVGRPHAARFDPAEPGRGVRRKYFCSELVTEACVAACLLDPATTRPVSMYPRELFFGTSRVPYIRNHLDMTDWDPPARWMPDLGPEPDTIKRRPYLDGDSDGPRSRP